jgi:hypothetical protein
MNFINNPSRYAVPTIPPLLTILYVEAKILGFSCSDFSMVVMTHQIKSPQIYSPFLTACLAASRIQCSDVVVCCLCPRHGVPFERGDAFSLPSCLPLGGALSRSTPICLVVVGKLEVSYHDILVKL